MVSYAKKEVAAAPTSKPSRVSQLTAAQGLEIFSQVVVGNNELYEVDLNTKAWTAGPRRFNEIPDWHKRGLTKPDYREGLPSTEDKPYSRLAKYRKDKSGKNKPFKDFVIYPSVDPYEPEIRALARLVQDENPIMVSTTDTLQQLVITAATRKLQPRGEVELSDGSLDKWMEKEIYVPYFKKFMKPKDLEKWLEGYFDTIDADSMLYDTYPYVREQGRSCIGMFPVARNRNGKFKLPEVLKIIKPEILRRPIVNLDTSEMAGVEVSTLTTNGAILDARRCVYFTLKKSLDLYGDFYGRIPIRSLIDVAKVILFIFGRDWLEAILQTWHTKPIFKHTLPSKDWSKVKPILENFNLLIEQSINKVVSVTNNVELLNPTGTDSGDIAGVNEILELAIKVIIGFDNIPLFMMGHGEKGNLGGNANVEEVHAFLKTKIKPQQEQFEKIIEDQLYDRVLAVLWDLEPENADKVPVKLKHNFEKPNISVPFDIDQWNVMMQLVNERRTTFEQVMEYFGLRHLMTDPQSGGTDASPAQKVFNPAERVNHPTWEPKGKIITKPLDRNFFFGGGSNANDLTQKKSDVLEAVKNKIKGDSLVAKQEAKLKKTFDANSKKMTAQFEMEKKKWNATREKEFLAAKKLEAKRAGLR